MARKSMTRTTRTARKRIEFVLEDAPGRNVAVAGTFNDWKPAKLLTDKTGTGVYVAVMLLEPGVYEYKFVVDGEWKLDERNPNFAPNSLGTLNSVLHVED